MDRSGVDDSVTSCARKLPAPFAEASMADTSTPLAPGDPWLASAWKGPGPGEDSGALEREAAATWAILQAPPGPAGPSPQASLAPACRSALEHLLQLFGAERAFLFATESRPGEAAHDPRMLDLIATVDADGEEVQRPEEKAPRGALEAAVRRHVPVAVTADARSNGEAAGDVQGLALPAEAGGGVMAVAFLENRFRPLRLTEETLSRARACCAALAASLRLGALRTENADLWRQIERLKTSQERLPATPPPPSPPARRAHAQRKGVSGDYSKIRGSSPKIIEMFQLLDKIAGSNATVLINGESGTGKELVAHAIHENSPRREKAFVSENCGALTETLLESELFGYVKGAFTGAGKDHKGLFELAEGGTLFLDEVGDMSTGMQKKLLRVLQEGVLRRVGGKEYIPVSVRVISATNKDLLEEVRAGNFREDLYYRLNVINLKLPPLRDRREDIPELVEGFLGDLAAEIGVAKDLEPEALQALLRYSWPGNIRELRNEVKRLYTLADDKLRLQDLSESILRAASGEVTGPKLESDLLSLPLKEATELLERKLIQKAMVECRGNRSLMAKVLQVPKTSLYNKIGKYNIELR